MTPAEHRDTLLDSIEHLARDRHEAIVILLRVRAQLAPSVVATPRNNAEHQINVLHARISAFLAARGYE